MSSSSDAIWSSLAWHLRRLLSGAERGRFGASPEMCFTVSGRPVADLNYAALWGAASEEEVEELVGHLADLDSMVVVSDATSGRLAPQLKDAGLVLGGSCPLMTVTITAAAPEGGPYRIEPVRDEERLAMMDAALADAYSLTLEDTSAAFGPGILEEEGATPFLAVRDGVAHSAVIATRVGADVGIWAMGTPARFQRRGAGRSLLEAIMSRFAVEGAERCFLFPSPAGRRLYDSLGFIEADRSEIWLKGSSTEFPDA